MRLLALLIFLGLAVLALWYDYKVARVAVESAFDNVEKFNSEVNMTAGRKYLTEKDVQQTLNRTPSRSFTEGVYHVEEYAFRSGLPLRTYKYYAVYSEGTPLVFLKHFKYELPADELTSAGGGGSAAGTAGSTTDIPADAPPPAAETEGKDAPGEPAAGQPGTAPAQPATDAPPADKPRPSEPGEARRGEATSSPAEPAPSPGDANEQKSDGAAEPN